MWMCAVDMDAVVHSVCVSVCWCMFLVENRRSEKGHTAMESIAET